MTAVASTDDAVVATPQSVTAIDVPLADADERVEYEQTVLHIQHIPRELGWLLFYVGVLGVAVPGIIGTPFLLVGGAVLVPGGRKWLSRWVSRNPSRFVRASLKQINRMADDLERRYPSLPEA